MTGEQPRTRSRSWLQRSSLVFLFDVLMVPVAWLSAYWLRFNLHSPGMMILDHAVLYLLLIMALQGLVCWWFGLYRGMWRFASLPDLIKIIKAALVGTLLTFLALFFITRLNAVPRSVIPLYFILYTILLASARFVYRYLNDHGRWFSQQQRVLIVGAGAAAESLVRHLWRDRAQALCRTAHPRGAGLSLMMIAVKLVEKSMVSVWWGVRII